MKLKNKIYLHLFFNIMRHFYNIIIFSLRWYPERFKVVAGTVNLEIPESTMLEAQVAEVSLHDLFHYEEGTAIPTNDVALLRVRTIVFRICRTIECRRVSRNTDTFERILNSNSIMN